jgi:hypothetical protein
MTASHGNPPLGRRPDGDASVDALVAALEGAATGIWCFAGSAAAPVWANARARAIGDGRLPVVGGRDVADLVALVLRSGRPEAVSGPLGAGGPPTTALVRPLPVAGAPGALLLLETDHDAVGSAV